MKKTINSIEQLYPLIGSDSRYGYHYGMFCPDYDTDYYFQVSYSDPSPLCRLGAAPILKVLADGHEYKFPALHDPDMPRSWMFKISLKELGDLYEAHYVDSVQIMRRDKILLDLSACETDVWSSFFRAAWADCGENHKGVSIELEEFHVQRILAAVRYQMNLRLDKDKVAREKLSSLAMDPCLSENILHLI